MLCLLQCLLSFHVQELFQAEISDFREIFLAVLLQSTHHSGVQLAPEQTSGLVVLTGFDMKITA